MVNCGGMWGRELGKMAGVHVPLHAAEHYECWDQAWPNQYLAAKPQPPQPARRRRRQDSSDEL